MSSNRKSLSAATDRTLRTNAQTIDRAIRSIMLSGEAPIAVRTIRSLQKVQDLESLNSFQKGAKIEDDITLVVIKITD